MAYRYGNRRQGHLFPPSFEELVGEDHPVRAYDAMIDAIDMESIGFELNPRKVGNSQYDPRTMLKLLVYGYSYGTRSSRKLERACHENISFIWLVGGLKPDHKTIAEFRRKNSDYLSKVIKQCARICIKLNLIAGNVLFLDGTKVRADASQGNRYSKAKAKKVLKSLDKRIAALLKQCETIDEEESGAPSYIKLTKDLTNKQKLREKVSKALETLENEPEQKEVNMTDPSCRNMHSRQGTNPAYNGQIVVDDENGLIVNSDVVTDGNDLNQFKKQIDEANDILDQACGSACADAGYSNGDALEEVANQGINVVVPHQKQATREPLSDFDKTRFQYNAETDTYICPANKELVLCKTDRKAKKYIYYGRKHCAKCPHFGKCTNNSKQGRSITRYFNEEFRNQLARNYTTDKNQKIYERRKSTCELPFGHIKHNLGADRFLLRGIGKVKAEMSILCSCFNIARLITILGVEPLVAGLDRA